MVCAFQQIGTNFAGYTNFFRSDMKTLAQLPVQQASTVKQITDCELKPKLLEMGLYSGKTVKVLFKAPFGDPIAVDVDGYVLSMRLDEASLVELEELNA